MNQRMLSRLSIDLIMTILILAQMAYRVTGNMVHELIGISLFVFFIIHNVLNIRWYKTIFSGEMNAHRIVSITVNLLLLITMLILIISAIPISRVIFTFFTFKGGYAMRQIHTLAAYWALIFTGIHLGMHWEMIMGGIRRITKVTHMSFILTTVLRVFVILIVIYGVKASFDRNIGSKLILYYTFDIWNSDESLIKILLDYLSIMVVYISGTHYGLKIAQKRKKAKK